jgi:uncharacterized protein (TIGR00266 family)
MGAAASSTKDGESSSGSSSSYDEEPVKPYNYEITGGQAFAELIVQLNPGQRIMADAGALQFMREGVERGSAKLGGGGGLSKILGAATRVAAGESAFQVQYRAKNDASSDESRRLALASSLPGNVLAIEMRPGESYKLSRGAFLACSHCVKISGKLNWRGAITVGQDQGIVLPVAKCEGNDAGTLFVSSYGSYVKHTLREGESLLVDNGLFLACPGDVTYEVVTLAGSLTSALLGGEGLGMKFSGPCTIFTQSRNVNDLAAQIASRIEGNRKSSLFGGGCADSSSSSHIRSVTKRSGSRINSINSLNSIKNSQRSSSQRSGSQRSGSQRSGSQRSSSYGART